MLSALIPEIPIQFNFDGVLLLIFIAYIEYGYLSGGHKQIRLSINLILPFVIIYYMGSTITNYLYVPLSKTFFFEIVSEYLDFAKNTITMVFAYITTYFVIFFGIFILSIYAKKYLLNENMRAKLGKKNNYLGALFSFINGYVLVYFIILPAFSINLVSTNSSITNFVLEHPPPFSRIARTAEKAVPVKNLADKAEAFQQLLSSQGLEQFYNEGVKDYQAAYMGAADSKETLFMTFVYPKLTNEAKTILEDAYRDAFGENLTASNYYGVSYILVTEPEVGTYLYQDLVDEEQAFNETYAEAKATVLDYVESQDDYVSDLENYNYTQELDQYELDLESYLTALEAYETAKVNALLSGTTFTDTFTLTRPELTTPTPENFVRYEGTTPPTNPADDVSQEVQDASDYVDTYNNKEDVTELLQTYGTDFEQHAGLLRWYIEGLSNGTNTPANMDDISSVIVSYKNNYDAIIENVNDQELEQKLYFAQMSIRSYDVFILWLDCTMEHIDTIPLDEIPLESSRCPVFDASQVTEYSFTDNAFSVVSTLFEGESVSWIISQFKYDYDAGLFDAPFEDFPEVQDVLVSTKGLVDEYEKYYKDIANSIEGNIPMIMKIGISVMKCHRAVFDT